MAKDISALLRLINEKKASDLHITANWPAQIRIDEKLVSVDDHVLSAEDAKSLIYSMLTKNQIDKFERDLELDLSFEVKGLSRFRVNVFRQRGSVGASIRLIPYQIWSFEECGLPVNIVTNLCKKPKGLSVHVLLPQLNYPGAAGSDLLQDMRWTSATAEFG